ncbi:unnamed protein product [Candidula unifasciata]|uniref:Receptor ligand binding region domain-containing protein n=1 Tax=Candidula unifasciata TaxID=100452 RepID=A0A8S3Z207_9EUPU|nr:unnamed protein product [Candidula unifasciata]
MSVHRCAVLKLIFVTCLLNDYCVELTTTVPHPNSHVQDCTACESPAIRRHRENKIQIGVILPFSGDYEYRLDLVRPALEHAREYIYSNTSLIRNYTMEFDYRDSKCSETHGPLEAIDMYTKKSADLFLGPACDYAIAVVARFTRFWNIPIISAGALVAAFIMGSFDKLAEFVLSVLIQFHYKQIGMITYTNKNELHGKSTCWFTMEPIYLLVLTQLNSNLSMKYVETFDDTDSPAKFEKSLKELSNKCRGEVNSSNLI